MKLFNLSLVAVVAGLVTGCSSTAVLKPEYAGYKYNNEKYGKIQVTKAEQVEKNQRKSARVEELKLADKLMAELKAAKIYDASAADTITVDVTHLRFRGAFTAIFWGVMAGPDKLQATVTLKKGASVVASFDVSISYALGGTAGGPTQTRLDWIGKKFAEEAVKVIASKQTTK